MDNIKDYLCPICKELCTPRRYVWKGKQICVYCYEYLKNK